MLDVLIDVPLAHGLQIRSDLPIPEWLFGWGAAMVLLVSFVALAVLWPKPKLQDPAWRPLPAGLSRVLLSTPVDVLCGAIGVFLLGVVVWSGLSGVQTSAANFAPTFVYVVFWLGLIPLSVLFGDVFRAFNPWRAVGRLVSWVSQKAAGGELPAPLRYPERLGHWPAAVGIFAFATLELVYGNGDLPEKVAVAALVYSALTWIAMALYGVEAWIERGEAFSVYFGLFARISPVERRGDRLGLRPPLSGLPRLKAIAGTVPLLAVMIGSTSFDGGSEGELWGNVTRPPGLNLPHFFENLGLSQERALEAAFLLGLFAACVLVYVFYRLGIEGARSVGGGFRSGRLAGEFVHSLVPISLAYVGAHYFTLLLFQGQAMIFLASNPLGEQGTDLFGTADRAIDYTIIGATATWYWQVAFVVAGHVAALILAHDRAIALYDDVKLAVRSQYWMLAVMVGFTSFALWLLSAANG